MRRDVFQAIADPTRRKIIHTLAQKPLNLNTVAQNFHISRPAVSKHIKILSECGLVIIKQTGRERYCEINFKSLAKIADWIEQYRVFWTQKLDALETFLKKENNAGKSYQPKKIKNIKKLKPRNKK
ncbi:MAG TPA: metalloregulator ArsR/SmtB family transcription factor [Parafilimonas sp.]